MNELENVINGIVVNDNDADWEQARQMHEHIKRLVDKATPEQKRGKQYKQLLHLLAMYELMERER